MLQTDKYYRQPTVFKLITALKERYIQLDTFDNVSDIVDGSDARWVNNMHMRVVSYVSDNAAAYPNIWGID